MVTEWEITKMEVENEMEIFITSTKYNTCPQHEEGKPPLVVTTGSAYYPRHNSFQHIYEEWDIPTNGHR